MKIQSVKKQLKQLNYVKKTFKKYKKHLLRGKYFLYPTMHAVVINEPLSKTNADRLFNKPSHNRKSEKLITVINKLGYLCNRKKTTDDTYEALYIANNYDAVREIKLFSFIRKKILTVCVNQTSLDQLLSLRERVHHAFPIPGVAKSDLYPNAAEVSMIELLPRPNEINALTHIASSMIQYRRSVSNTVTVPIKNLLTLQFHDKELNAPLAELLSWINPEILEAEITLCQQHGDLSSDNLIYGICEQKESYWWIDWEHLNERVFFYDFFFYILNTAMCDRNFAPFNSYISGECDNILEQYFSVFDMKYHSKNAKDYFLIFAIVFLKERVCQYNYKNALTDYFELLKKLLFHDRSLNT